MTRCGMCGIYAPPATAELTGEPLCQEHYRAAEARLERSELVMSEPCLAEVQQELHAILGHGYVPDLAVVA